MMQIYIQMKLLSVSILLAFSTHCTAQSFRLHIGGGFENYIGDIQQKRLSFNQINGMYSFGASYDINDRLAIRIDYSNGKVEGDDKKSGSTRITKRNLNFKSNIQEVSVMGEYSWANDYTGPFVPYVFAGVGVFKFSPYTLDSAGRTVYLHELSTEGQGLKKYPDRKVYKLKQLNIPFGAGIKYNFTEDIFCSLEGGIRKLFTDYLDDVSTSYPDRASLLAEKGQLAVDLSYRADEVPPYNQSFPKGGSQRGNKDKDWYYFAQFRISFRLKWNDPSGGSFRNSGKSSLRRLGCPGRF